MQRQNCKKKFKIGRRGSRFLEHAECDYIKLLFCKERQRSENNDKQTNSQTWAQSKW